MTSYVREELEATLSTLQAVLADEQLNRLIEQIAAVWVDSLQRGNKILFAGNGGSAADAQHLAGELVGRFNYDRPCLAGIALTTDTSVLTAIGNDYAYDQVFARQVKALGRPGDVLVAISTSGCSPNILRALEEGKRLGISTVGFTGCTGGKMVLLCDYCVRIPSLETPKIQEGHVVLGHILCGLVERAMFPR